MNNNKVKINFQNLILFFFFFFFNHLWKEKYGSYKKFNVLKCFLLDLNQIEIWVDQQGINIESKGRKQHETIIHKQNYFIKRAVKH